MCEAIIVPTLPPRPLAVSDLHIATPDNREFVAGLHADDPGQLLPSHRRGGRWRKGVEELIAFGRIIERTTTGC